MCFTIPDYRLMFNYAYSIRKIPFYQFEKEKKSREYKNFQLFVIHTYYYIRYQKALLDRDNGSHVLFRSIESLEVIIDAPSMKELSIR